MKICFSTLACPGWTLERVLKIAASSGYDAIELRFLEGEESLWKLPAFQGAALQESAGMIADHGISVACVGTSCRFHSPDPKERAQWVEEGVRMAGLAAALGAPGIRVFGDKIQPGADRDSTRAWIAEGIRELAERTQEESARVWLETHGNFASSAETMAIITQSSRQDVGVVWDPANAFTDGQEQPLQGVRAFGTFLQHVHLRDVECRNGQWEPVLAGEGKLGLSEIVAELRRLNYDHFVSFEWEKKWRPELAEPETAIPHFARWFKENSQNSCLR
jgi:sugar phosphate isomerase/epimerase